MGNAAVSEDSGARAVHTAGVAVAGATLWRRIAPLLVALLALGPYTWVAYHYSDLPQFGKYQDEGLLLIAGKSLHDGDGYLIASLPGKPFQTKYQPLYPMLLALVWSADPRFPENLRILSVLQWLITTGFFATAFWLFRSTGFASWKGVAMAVFLATNPWLLYWSLLPIADSLFALLVVSVFLLLHRRRDNPGWWWVIGCIGAAACLTKVAGILMVPAIWAGGWRRAQWRRSLILTAPMLMAFMGWTVWASLHRAPGENSVLWYYTDYIGFHIKNGGLAALPEIVQSNLGSLIATVGGSVFYNLADTFPGRLLSVVIGAAWISGIRRLAKRTSVVEYSVFSALLVLLLLVWNFSPNVRLLAPALPLLAMGLCAEAEHFFRLIQSAAGSRKMADRMAARTLGAGLVAACLAALVLNVNLITRGIPDLLDHDRLALDRDRVTFDWCRRTLPASAVVLANNDTYLHLSTGLMAVRPVLSSVALYRHDRAGQLDNFTHIDRLVDFFGITHILITPDDLADFEPAERNQIREMLLHHPRFRKIYSTDDSLNGSVVLEVATPAGPERQEK
jgi:hypothetical protein